MGLIWMCPWLSSPSTNISIPLVLSAFLLWSTNSTKLWPDRPSWVGDALAKRSIFPPHVTLRLGTFKTIIKGGCSKEDKKVVILIWQLVTFCTQVRLVLVTSSLVRFLILSSCSTWSWCFSWRSWESTSLSVAVVCVSEETCSGGRGVSLSQCIESDSAIAPLQTDTALQSKKQSLLPPEVVSWGRQFHYDIFWAAHRHQKLLWHVDHFSFSLQC